MKNYQIFKNGALALLGILLLAIPGKLFSVAVIILGCISVYNGILILITERKLLDNPAYKKIVQFRGFTGIIVGAFAVLCPILVGGSVWAITCITMAIWILISGITEFFAAILLSRNEIDAKSLIIESIVSVIVAIILFVLSSAEGRNTFLRIIGTIMLLSSIVCFLIAKKYPGKETEFLEPENVETINPESEN